jgi:hypothetical protein
LVVCFLQASKPQYRDEESYKNSWLRLLSLESAHSSSLGSDSVIIHNVSITWTQNGTKPTGTFTLPLRFCIARQILFSGVPGNEDEEDEHNNHNKDDNHNNDDSHNNDPFLDYFCVRYSELIPPVPSSDHVNKFDVDFELPYTWVGHCLSTKKMINKEKTMVTMTLQLHQNAVEMPEVLLRAGQEHEATVEFIPKALPSR